MVNATQLPPTQPSFEDELPQQGTIELAPESDSSCGVGADHAVQPLYIKSIPIGEDRYLTLKKELTFEFVDHETLKVVDWDLTYDLYGNEDVLELVAREFLRLLARAEADVLTREEKLRLANIGQYIDYGAYRDQDVEPLYVWGTISEFRKKSALTLHSGDVYMFLDSLENLGLGLFQHGDKIEAFVDLGDNGYIEGIYRPSLRAELE